MGRREFQAEANLTEILTDIHARSQLRLLPTVEATKQWHRLLLRGLAVPEQRFVAAFRGEDGLRNIGVRVAGYMGAALTDLSRGNGISHISHRRDDYRSLPPSFC